MRASLVRGFAGGDAAGQGTGGWGRGVALWFAGSHYRHPREGGDPEISQSCLDEALDPRLRGDDELEDYEWYDKRDDERMRSRERMRRAVPIRTR
jgi:hypothetical protein